MTGPRPPAGALRFAEVAAGYFHSCGLAVTGTAYCWGDNTLGTLGDGTRQLRTQPTAVAGPPFQRLDAGAGHNCALTTAGVAWCWGQNDEGQAGDGTFAVRDSPVPVAGGHAFTAISAGHAHSCALTAAGAGWWWGDDSRGQLGNGADAEMKSSVPVRVIADVPFTRIYAGYYQTCALTAAGAAYCWGLNDSAQNGDGTAEDRHAPVPVQGGRSFTMLAPGDRFVCGVSGSAAWCWGANRHGELGAGVPGGSAQPVQIAGTSGTTTVFAAVGASTLAGSQAYGCALPAGRVFCWGGAIRALRAAGAAPGEIDGRFRATAVAAGADHVCVLTRDAYAFCGGGNYLGQLGDGTRTDRSQLVGVNRP